MSMETRIQKYKNYRAELIKEGAVTFKKDDTPMTTTALPLKEVMAEASTNNALDAYYKKERRHRIIQLVLISALLIAIIIGLIIFGIYAWGTK